MLQLASGRALALQACANMLWALGVLGSANNATVTRIVHFMSQKDCGDLLSTQYHQLFQVQHICFALNVYETRTQSDVAVQHHYLYSAVVHAVSNAVSFSHSSSLLNFFVSVSVPRPGDLQQR